MAGEPKYRQIAEDLRGRIDGGELAAGKQVQTEIELMEYYSASRNTIRDALKLLTAQNLVETRPGQGTFVIEKSPPFLVTLTGAPDEWGAAEVRIAKAAAADKKVTFSEPRVEVQRARPKVADSLQIAPGSQVVSRHQQVFFDGDPWSLETSFYPMTFVEQGATKLLQAEDIGEGVIAYLRKTLGTKQDWYQDSISVRSPDSEETRFFRLPADGRVPVFEVHRTGFGADGHSMRLTIRTYRADENRLIATVGAPQSRS